MSDKKKSIGFLFAWNGILEIFREERNFRIHFSAALMVVIAGFIFELTKVEWAVIILVIGMVLIAEITNSVIERMIDYLKPEMHASAKSIKDIAAGAVLTAVIIAMIIGLIIFLPRLYSFF
ncbi:diacylglycerol kinase family protein [Virgibacillus ainsalahensis]